MDEIKELQLKNYEEEKIKIRILHAKLQDEITKKTNKLLEDLKSAIEKTQDDIANEKSHIEKVTQDFKDKIYCVNDVKTSNNIETVRTVSEDVQNQLKLINTSFSILPLEYKQFVEENVTDTTLTKAIGSLECKLLPYLTDFQVLKSYDTNFVEIGSLSSKSDGTVWISDWWGEFSNDHTPNKTFQSMTKFPPSKKNKYSYEVIFILLSLGTY